VTPQKKIVLRATGWGLLALGFLMIFVPGSRWGSLVSYYPSSGRVEHNAVPLVFLFVFAVAGIVCLVIESQSKPTAK
jgi:hypothetical protein